MIFASKTRKMFELNTFQGFLLAKTRKMFELNTFQGFLLAKQLNQTVP